MDIYKILYRNIRLMLQSTLVSCSILGYYNLLTREFFEIGMCKGVSMKPILNDKSLILIKKFNVYNVKRGDIVVCRSPNEPEKLVCKRVTHLPYDIVERGRESVEIKKGHVWLEGENSFVSIDSRAYGAVPKGLLVGKVIFVVWPFGKVPRI